MTRQRLILLARVAISVVLIVLVFIRADLPRSLQLLAHSHLLVVALGLLAGVAGVVISSAQWRVLLRAEAIRLSLAALTRLYFFGYSFNVVLPTTIGGDAVKAAFVARLSGKTAGALGATIMARVVGFGVMLLTALPVSLSASVAWGRFGWSPTILLLVAAAGFIAVLLLLRWGHRLTDRPSLAHYRLWRPVTELSRTLSMFMLRPAALLGASLLSLLFYLTLYLNYYLFGLGVGLRAPFWFYWIAVPVLSIVTLIPISFNGYGLREGSAVLLFRLTGDSASAALSLALLVEIQLVLFALLGAAVQPRFQRT
jgi:uncharacterized protein (TIRG00374 family)